MESERRAAALLGLLLLFGALACAQTAKDGATSRPGSHLGGAPIAPPTSVVLPGVPIGDPSASTPGTAAISVPQILYWSSSRAFVDGWVRTVPTTNADRLERLRAMFVKDECVPELRPVGDRGTNLVCTLPGEALDVVVIGAHYDHAGKGEGAIENWSGAAMLPLLYHAMKATKRHSTYVFAAFDGKKGAQAFFKKLSDEDRAHVVTMLDLSDLGLSGARSCSFPDNSISFMQDLGLEQVLLAVAKAQGVRGMPQRESCYEMIKIDDTDAFRKAGVPVLIIHSITHEKHSVPGSEQDTAAAIDAASYYSTYQLLATYLCLIDRNLRTVLTPGAYDPLLGGLNVPRPNPLTVEVAALQSQMASHPGIASDAGRAGARGIEKLMEPALAGAAAAPASSPHETAREGPPVASLNTVLAEALVPGTPPMNQILLRGSVDRSADHTPNKSTDGLPGEASAGMVQYRVDFTAFPHPRDKGPDGHKLLKEELIFAASASTADGKQLEPVTKSVDLDLTPEERQKIEAEGVRFELDLSVPAMATGLILGVFEDSSQQVGTLQISLAPLNGK